MTDRNRPSSETVIDRLAAFETLSHVPRAELEWLVDHSEFATYTPGQTMVGPGEPVDNLWIAVSGAVVFEVDRGAGPRRVMTWEAGAVGGILPYSRLETSPGRAYPIQPTELVNVHKRLFPELISACPVFTADTVHLMLDRARRFNASDLHDEKMVSLGRMAAGLAHELNNPASAAVSDARLLAAEIVEADLAARAFGALGLDPERQLFAEEMRDACVKGSRASPGKAIERAAHEERIEIWLDRHGVDSGYGAALAETPLELEDLDRLAENFEGEALTAALTWIATGCAVRALSSDIEKVAGRIHGLVTSVKRFSYMDRTGAPERVDLEVGLRDTLAVLRSKSRAKSIEVDLELHPDVPQILARGGELNQIWLNLIDNALDATNEGGRVEVRVDPEPEFVVVRVIDDGAGIPPAQLGDIFDAFYTTKEPGQGTGLGLDIARRLVRQSGGSIDVESRPGRTEFRVRLPVRRGG